MNKKSYSEMIFKAGVSVLIGASTGVLTAMFVTGATRKVADKAYDVLTEASGFNSNSEDETELED